MSFASARGSRSSRVRASRSSALLKRWPAMATNDALNALLAKLFKAHPWHGVVPGPEAPAVVHAYIEIVPTDAVKYELDKPSGHLRVDRPQRFSSMCPTPYGFIPQTYCGNRVGQLCSER